ncbi:MAG: PTS sugar transporter subunit IIA [Ancrocorticia sp.]
MTDTQGSGNVAQLAASRIQFTDEELDWKSAIRLAGKPLVDEGAITDAYIEDAIRIAEEKGPYFDLGRGIAMPHARPEAGVNQMALSFLRTRKPVLLLDREDHAIDVFIMLAAVDNKSHLGVLQMLAGVLTDAARVEDLKAATTPEEVLAIFGA